MFRQEDFEEKTIQMQQEIPVAGMQETVPPAMKQNYGDFIVRHGGNTEGFLPESYSGEFEKINETYGVLYVPLSQFEPLEMTSYSYNSIPICYTYMDLEGLNASGVTRLQNHPFLQLRGKGTAIAVIDSGIDYRNPVFLDGGGRTRIRYLWDQSITGEAEDRKKVPYGRLFLAEDINRALASENPLEIVPSEDVNGHGTALAGIAAGNLLPQENFSGAAPEASIFVVKLKPAKRYLREFYLFPQDGELFQENDIMFGISKSMEWAKELQMPLSVCLGVGSSQGAHMGESPLSRYISDISAVSGVSVSVPAGNEGAFRHHFRGRLTPMENSTVTELRVGEMEEGFSMEMWGEPPEVYMVSIQSPTGEVLNISNSLGSITQELSFVFVETKVLVNYIAIERETGYTLVYFRFLHPAPGIWKIRVQIRDGQSVNFHAWLPVQGMVSPDTFFLEASPYNTVTTPGDSRSSMTVTAYDYRDNSLYLHAGRGYTPFGAVVPHFAAPGVKIRVPLTTEGFGEVSGTSLAAAQNAGIAALLFEWAIIRENELFFTGIGVRHYLQRGAKRDEGMQYPNQEWGYGRVDLYHTFELLS